MRGCTVCVILTIALTRGKGGSAGIKAAGTEQRHNFEVAVGAQGRPGSAVVKWAQSANELSLVCDVSRRRITS